MVITLYLNDRLLHFRLPTSISGSFSFDYKKSENSLINIEAKDGKWNLYAIEDMIIYHNQKQVKSTFLNINEYYVIKRENNLYLIYINDPNEQKVLTYDYSNNLELLIGNFNKYNIYKNCPYFKEIFFEITNTNQGLQIVNKGKTNLYINQKASPKKSTFLKIGDEIDIYGLRLIFLKSFFLIITRKKN